MSKRVDVLEAVKALIEAALPQANVLGMDAEQAKPESVPASGMVIIRSGDPGDAQIDLSPPTYWFDHSIPIEIARYGDDVTTSQRRLDAMLTAIGTAILADRYLGGLCIWLDAQAPSDGETDMRGAVPLGWADFTIIATYSTTSPLG